MAVPWYERLGEVIPVDDSSGPEEPTSAETFEVIRKALERRE